MISNDSACKDSAPIKCFFAFGCFTTSKCFICYHVLLLSLPQNMKEKHRGTWIGATVESNSERKKLRSFFEI